MIILRNMRNDEFSAYCDYFVTDYSEEITLNYGHSPTVAHDLAKQALTDSFPNGLESDEHTLLCIEANLNGQLKVVGYLWHAIKKSESSTFIYDFYIDAAFRAKGYGKQAMNQLEQQLADVGIKQIKLRVAYHNQRALSLYQAVGFTISGYNMSKTITTKNEL